jgi:hypothetical protein
VIRSGRSGPQEPRSPGRLRSVVWQSLLVLGVLVVIVLGVVLALQIDEEENPPGDPGGLDPTETLETDETFASSPTESSSSDPHLGGDDAELLAALRDRCLRETSVLDEAAVRFDDDISVQTGEQTRFRVTLAPPGSTPSTAGSAPEQGRIKVACVVEARLVSSGSEVTVSPSDWSSDKYIPPEPTTWSWTVSAEGPGTSSAVLELRPAVQLSTGSGPVQEAALGTVEYDVTFRVSRSPSDQVGAAWKWVVAGVTFVGLVLGIVVSIATIRNHRGHQEPDHGRRPTAPSMPLGPPPTWRPTDPPPEPQNGQPGRGRGTTPPDT